MQLQTDLDVVFPIQYCSGNDPYTYAVNELFNHGIKILCTAISLSDQVFSDMLN